MKIIYFANTDWYLYNFRKELLFKAIDRGYEVVLISPAGKYGKKFLDEGLDWKPIFANRNYKALSKINLVQEARSLISVIKIYKDVKPDIAHHFTIQSVIYGSIAAKAVNTKVIVNAIAGLGFLFTSKNCINKIFSVFIAFLLKISCMNNKTKMVFQNDADLQQVIKKRIIKKSQAYLIPSSGVNLQKFKYIDKSKKQDNSINVLMASRLLRAKGVMEYIEAGEKFSKISTINFYLAGEPDFGNPSAISEAELDSIKNSSSTEYLGHIEDMAELYEKIDIFVLPTFYGEGVPKSLIEAGASGCVLITTDYPGCKEVVKHGETGLIVPPKCAENIVQAIKTLEKNKELRSNLSKNAREHIKSNFDIDIVNDKTIDLYSILETSDNY